MKSNNTPTMKKKNAAGLLIYIVLLVISGCVGFFGADAIDALLGGNDALLVPYLLLGIAGLSLGFVLQIILHEGGHLVFGQMSGYSFLSFNVFGFVWHKGENGRFRMSRHQIAGIGGQCLMAPPPYNDGNFPFILYNLGGVLMNLISAALFGLLMLLLPVTWLRILLAGQVIAGLISAVTNGLPIPGGTVQNDASNILCIRKDATARRAFWVQMSVAAAQGRGLRLKHMPDDWFEPLPEEKMDNPIVGSVAVMNTNRLMDQLDFEGALTEIRKLLAREKGVLGIYRALMTCDGAVCEMVLSEPGELTARLEDAEVSQVLKAMKTSPTVLRTRYAVSLLKDRDAAAAEKHLAAFEAAAKQYPNPQDIVSERELIFAVQTAALRSTLPAQKEAAL